MTERMRPHSIMNQFEAQENQRGNFNVPHQKRSNTPRKATHRYASVHEDPAFSFQNIESKMTPSLSTESMNLKTRKKQATKTSPEKKKILDNQKPKLDNHSDSEHSSVMLDHQDEEKEELMRNLEPRGELTHYQSQARLSGPRIDIKVSQKVKIKYLVQNNYNLYVHGPPCSGKTTIARDLLEEMGVAYRYIDCIILGDEKYIVSSIVSFLRMYILSDSTRNTGKLDQLIEFFRLFQKFKTENKKQLKYYVILDNLHAFKEGARKLLERLIEAFRIAGYFIDDFVLRLYLIDRTPSITFNFPDFGEVSHSQFEQIELKTIIEYKIYQNGGPRYQALTQVIIDQIFSHFSLYGNTIEYFVKSHFLIERHLRDTYFSRVGGEVTNNFHNLQNVKKCIEELAPFLKEDRYKKTYPTRDQIVLRKDKLKRKKNYAEDEEDDSFKRITQVEGAMMLASYLATYLSEKSDMNNFNPEGLNKTFRKKSQHHYRKNEKAKTVTGHNFQFPRFQAIFNYMLSLISEEHPELKYPFQSMRQLALLGEFLRGNFVIQMKKGSYRSLITHEQAAKIAGCFEIPLGDFLDLGEN